MANIDIWDCFALHTWLYLSSFGIIFALLSFFDELGGFDNIKKEKPWLKGLLAFIIGFIFYLFIGLRHLEGANKRQNKG